MIRRSRSAATTSNDEAPFFFFFHALDLGVRLLTLWVCVGARVSERHQTAWATTDMKNNQQSLYTVLMLYTILRHILHTVHKHRSGQVSDSFFDTGDVWWCVCENIV